MKTESQTDVTDGPKAPPAVVSSELVGLLTAGLEAAEGAQVLAECYFDLQEREPSNNDNYCRLLDWMKDVRRVLGKQPNESSSAARRQII